MYPGIALRPYDGKNSERNGISDNQIYDSGVGTTSYGIVTENSAQNFNVFDANIADGMVYDAWSVAGGDNHRNGNRPQMPLASGSVTVTAGGSVTVWENGFTSGHPGVSILETGGDGTADWVAEYDSANGQTEVRVREVSEAADVTVKWAVWP